MELAEVEADSTMVDQLFFCNGDRAWAEEDNAGPSWSLPLQEPETFSGPPLSAAVAMHVALQGQPSATEMERHADAAPSPRKRRCYAPPPPRLAHLSSNGSSGSTDSESWSTEDSSAEHSDYSFDQENEADADDDAATGESFKQHSPMQSRPFESLAETEQRTKTKKNGAKRKKSGVPKQASEVLKVWFFEHIEKPYPSADDKKILCARTGMSHTQIRNWFTNMRKRHWTPVKAGREPRSYVDFVLFKRLQEVNISAAEK